jgi:hypothetical protein
MSKSTIVTAAGRIRGVLTWTEGFKALKRPRTQPTEDDILATALWLEKHGQPDEALAFLERCLDEPHVH